MSLLLCVDVVLCGRCVLLLFSVVAVGRRSLLLCVVVCCLCCPSLLFLEVMCCGLLMFLVVLCGCWSVSSWFVVRCCFAFV